jgi:hypothetical protein
MAFIQSFQLFLHTSNSLFPIMVLCHILHPRGSVLVQSFHSLHARLSFIYIVPLNIALLINILFSLPNNVRAKKSAKSTFPFHPITQLSVYPSNGHLSLSQRMYGTFST